MYKRIWYCRLCDRVYSIRCKDMRKLVKGLWRVCKGFWDSGEWGWKDGMMKWYTNANAPHNVGALALECTKF